MTNPIIFFHRTLAFLESIRSNIYFDQSEIANIQLVSETLEKKLTEIDYYSASSIYNFESEIYSFFNSTIEGKSELYSNRIEHIISIKKLIEKSANLILSETYRFNPKNLVLHANVDIFNLNNQQDLNIKLDGPKNKFSYYIKPCLLLHVPFVEIYLAPDSFEYILVDLKEHAESFSGWDFLNALVDCHDNFPSSKLKSTVIDKLLQYLIVYDALIISD